MTIQNPKPFSVGFDLGGTKMLAAAYDADFNMVGSKRKKTSASVRDSSGLDRIATIIRSVLDSSEIAVEQVAAIGVGCPGPIDLDRGVVLEAPNLGWRNVDLKSTLENEFDCPVVITNDVDAGVYGEFRFGVAQEQRCVLGIFPGTGIGGGLIYDGQIVRGKVVSSMEIGHIPVIPDGPLCGCGQRGCLESVASRLAVSAAAAQAAFRGQAPNLRAMGDCDLSKIRSGQLAAAIKAGDSVIERIVREAARWIGTVVGGLVNMLSPDVILLGGGMVEAMPEIYLSEVKKAARSRSLVSLRDSFEVLVSELGDWASVKGAAGWARHVVEDQVEQDHES